jgi:hypothetical protein
VQRRPPEAICTNWQKPGLQRRLPEQSAPIGKSPGCNGDLPKQSVDYGRSPGYNGEYIPWDKLHTLGKKKIDAIIHLAGKAHDTRNTAAEQDYFDIASRFVCNEAL